MVFLKSYIPMKVLLVTATSFELNSFSERHALKPFNKKEIKNGLGVYWIVTGVGMVHTTYHVTKALLNDNYDLALNAGICGSFDGSLNIGEVVNVKTDMFAELGAEDNERFLDVAELNLANPSEYPYDELRLIGSDFHYNKHLRNVSGITVNRVHGSVTSIAKTVERLDPQVESMEGAAFMYCCMQEHVNCFQLRAVSNYVEPRNRDAWNIPLAIKNLDNTLEDLINLL